MSTRQAAIASSSSSTAMTGNASLRFIDIGVNLTDPVFRGKSPRTGKHPDDTNAMLQRAKNAGLKSMIITGGSLRESREAIALAKKYGVYATAGCHPTRSTDFDKFEGGPEAYLRALDRLIAQNKTGIGRVVAVGECGLDNDRLFRAPAETQQKYFRMQLGLAKKHHLPLFLHSRAARSDFAQIMREEGFGEDGGRALGARGGVIHSFTGGLEELEELLSMGFYISVNGCGMKTAANLEASAAIPLDRLMLETDAPWCTLNSTHASNAHLKTLPKGLSDVFFPASTRTFEAGKMVKGRNEPNAIGGVAWVMSRLKGVSLEEVMEASWKNTMEVFGLDEDLDINVPADLAAPTAAPLVAKTVPKMDEASFPALR